MTIKKEMIKEVVPRSPSSLAKSSISKKEYLSSKSRCNEGGGDT